MSVLRWDVDQELIRPFHHLQIEVDDDEDEILLEYFPACNKFIHDALEAKGNVFVHWQVRLVAIFARRISD